MKTFRTLRGLLAGDEPEEMEPSFRYQAILRIMSDGGLDFEEIETSLGLQPTASRRRGEKASPRSPPSRQDLWMFRAPVDAAQELREHIDALWRALKPHAQYLRSLKSRASVDVFLGYSSNIDHAGVTIPHQSLEMFTALELDVGLSVVVVSEDP